jgi:hypothetical protein
MTPYDEEVTCRGEWHLPTHARSVMPPTPDTPLLATQLYGLCGFIGSGKNTAGDVLVSATQGKTLSFAGPLKDGVAAIFGWDRELVEGTTQVARAWREQPDAYWSEAFGRRITPRIILQEMGTDVCRTWLGNIWVAAAGRRHTPPHTSVFTDARFGNEMQWIADQGGTLIWVYRPQLDHLAPEDASLIQDRVMWNARLSEPLTLHTKLHASETSFLTEGADLLHLVVRNTGTVDDLTLTMQHIHQVLSRGDHLQLPWGETTIYVDRDGKNFTWIYREPDTNEQTGRVYNAKHVRVG